MRCRLAPFVKHFLLSVFSALLGFFAAYASFVFCISLAIDPRINYDEVVYLSHVEIALLYAGVLIAPVSLSAILHFMSLHSLIFSWLVLAIPICSLILGAAYALFMVYLFQVQEFALVSKVRFWIGLFLFLQSTLLA